MSWLKDLFKTEKPIVAMCHFRSLPGDPYYDRKGGMQQVIDYAHQEMCDLQAGGVDAIMFSNEFSLPYLKNVRPVTTATMARMMGREVSPTWAIWDRFNPNPSKTTANCRIFLEV